MVLRQLRVPALAGLLLGLAVLAGCGGQDGDDTAFVPIAGTESAYCETYRAFQVYMLDRPGGVGIEADPAAYRKHWNQYLIVEETLLRDAPEEIRDEVRIKVSGIRTLITPVLEKYDFDAKRVQRDGTAAERALVDGAPAAVRKAQDVQHAYEDRVCGVANAPAADVVFQRDAASKDYCGALATLNRTFEESTAARLDPDVTRKLFTADGFTDSLDAVKETAPTLIAADVAAHADWLRGRWRDVFDAFDYDIRRVWMEGTPEDRAVVTLRHPDVVSHASRVAAYEEQVCNA